MSSIVNAARQVGALAGQVPEMRASGARVRRGLTALRNRLTRYRFLALLAPAGGAVLCASVPGRRRRLWTRAVTIGWTNSRPPRPTGPVRPAWFRTRARQAAATFTENSRYAAIENRSRKMFGLQFHPEVVHTPRGKEILANFVHDICGCGKNWTMRGYAERAIEEIRAQVGGEKVILGLSGGVDSSVAAALLHKAIGKQLTCIFVNNGLLRAHEAETVRKVFGRHFHIKLQYEDASKLFLRRLKGRDGAGTQTENHRQNIHRSL